MTVGNSFYRTELRVMQNLCNGDNDKFLGMIAELIESRDTKFDKLLRDVIQVVRNTDLCDVEGGDSAVIQAVCDELKNNFGV